MFKIDNELLNPNVSRTVRFPDKLFERLTETALSYQVSFNSLILQCCKYALENQENKPNNP